jgi:tRNA modification GTPase
VTANSHDTIVAVATPPGQGGIGVVRLSGPQVPTIARAVLGDLPAPRHASLRRFRDHDGAALDLGLALYFAAPESFTGEHVLELHGHGGPAVMQSVVARCLALGARLARPGEFTERAFINDQCDLTQAEAVADLIAAGSAAAARAAARTLTGAFARAVGELDDGLTSLRVYVEAAIDFPDEEGVAFLEQGRVAERLAALGAALDALAARAHQGALLRDGFTLAIVGRPNAGKSSLMNALAGRDTAIVTAIPGTTRDLLRERIDVDGLPIHLTDTAGLRESADEVEREGIKRARDAVASCDHALLVLDATDPAQTPDALFSELPTAVPATVLLNKCDLTGDPAGVVDVGAAAAATLRISAKTGAGFDALRARIREAAGYAPVGEGAFSARRRHLDALAQARTHLETAGRVLAESKAGELVAEELRQAQDRLGEITGATTPDDLLGEIFGRFCIGK